jgi:hypothetical protein
LNWQKYYNLSNIADLFSALQKSYKTDCYKSQYVGIAVTNKHFTFAYSKAGVLFMAAIKLNSTHKNLRN